MPDDMKNLRSGSTFLSGVFGDIHEKTFDKARWPRSGIEGVDMASRGEEGVAGVPGRTGR